jgi:hypothetical protein
MPRFQTARFHAETGPDSLFERVRQKMAGRRNLKLHADHFRTQAAFRGAPVESLREFDSSQWKLATVEVRTDTGKFINSAWTREIDGRCWWLVIGLHDTVVTVIETDKRGLGRDILRSGKLYELVADVNRRLLDDDQTARG